MKFKLSNILLILLLVVCLFVSCEGDADEELFKHGNTPTPTPVSDMVTVTFNANGGTGTMEPQEFTKGTPANLNECTFTAPAGKVFGGWVLSADGTDIVYADKSQYPADNSRTLYARWLGSSKLLGEYDIGADFMLSNFNKVCNTYVNSKSATITKIVFRVGQTAPASITDDMRVSVAECEYPAWLEISGNTLYVNTNGKAFEAPVNSSCMFIGVDVETFEFSFMHSVESIDFGTDLFDTSKTTDMVFMFAMCPSLKTLDVSCFDTSKVESMVQMFEGCESLTSLNISNLNTTKVTNMNSMFEGCESLTSLNVSGFNTSQVTDMSSMFEGCESLISLDLSSFNTSQVTDMSSMFCDCSGLTSISVGYLDTSQVTEMSHMFSGCESLETLDLSSFNVSEVVEMDHMFDCCKNLTTLTFSVFNTEKVEYMSFMFNICTKLKYVDFSSFNTSSVVDMSGMFASCENLETLDISSFDTSNVQNMGYMFNNCGNINQLTLGSNFKLPISDDGMFSGFATSTGTHTITVPNDDTRYNLLHTIGIGLSGWTENGNDLIKTI